MYKARVESEFRSRVFGLCMPPGKDGFAKSAACFYIRCVKLAGGVSERSRWRLYQCYGNSVRSARVA